MKKIFTQTSIKDDMCFINSLSDDDLSSCLPSKHVIKNILNYSKAVAQMTGGGQRVISAKR